MALSQEGPIKNVFMELPTQSSQEILNHRFKVSKEEKATPKPSLSVSNHLV